MLQLWSSAIFFPELCASQVRFDLLLHHMCFKSTLIDFWTFIHICSSNLFVKCWMGSRKCLDCLVNRPQTLLSPLVVYWSKSTFRISLMYNCGSVHLINFDCFILGLKRSTCYIQKKVIWKIRCIVEIVMKTIMLVLSLQQICAQELFSLVKKLICCLLRFTWKLLSHCLFTTAFIGMKKVVVTS